MTTVEILKRARDHIAKPGQWYRGEFSPKGLEGAYDGMSCCTWGAVEWAAGRKNPDEYRLPLVFLKKATPDGSTYPWDFNDAPGRTQEEVVALFDRAIELAEKEHTP